MSGPPTIQQNQIPPDPELADVLNIWAKNLKLGLNCHHIGTVQAFNAVFQTVQATINYTRVYFTLDDKTNTYVQNNPTYPLLVDVPVISLSGGTGGVTLPISAGDQCLVLFNDRDMDNWWSGQPGGPPATGRLHSIADAIAIVGLFPKISPSATKLAFYDPQRAVVRGGAGVVGVNTSNGKVLITNTAPSGTSGGNLTYSSTLNTLLQNLITQLNNLISAVAGITVLPGTFNVASAPVAGVSGIPVNAATISAISTQLTTIATSIGALLE